MVGTASTSVVMVSYRTGAVLKHAVQSVLKQEGLHELIVVDNGNPPGTFEHLQLTTSDSRLKIVTGHGNVGFAKGCNLGAQAATGRYLLLLNPDCLLPENTLVTMAVAMQNHPEAMVAGCRLLNADGSEQRGSRRELLTPFTAFTESTGLHRLLPLKRLNNHRKAAPTRACAVPAISGAFMFFRRGEYTQLGGLDEGYFLHVEDLDLCLRIQRAGRTVMFVPEASAVHFLSTSESSSRFIERCKAEGFSRYFRLHFPTALPWMIVPIWLRCAVKSVLPRNTSTVDFSAKLMLLLASRDKKPVHDLAGKTVLVTGATSPVGMLLAGRLLGAGAHVKAVTRGEGFAIPVDGLEWVRSDINTPGFIPPSAHFMVHCAPLWLLQPALAARQKTVAFGSTSVFAKEHSTDRNERLTAQKLQKAEEALAGKATILRPTLIYGTGLDANVARIKRFIRRFGFFPLYPPAGGLRQPVHAEDLAIAAINALLSERSVGRAYDVSGGETLTYRDMVVRVFASCGKRPRILMLRSLPLLLDVAGRLLHKTHVNAEMARRMNTNLTFTQENAARDFGYAPREFTP